MAALMDICLSDTARWYCAITNPNCQRRAELELASLGYRTFTPKVRKWVTHARVRKAVERPLLGRYLFVHLDPDLQGFHAIRGVNGVEGIVGMCGTPSAFPSRQVEDLLRRQLAGEWDEVAKGKLAVGARIRVMEGEFADMLATVTNVKGRKVSFKVLDSRTYGTVHDFLVRAA